MKKLFSIGLLITMTVAAHSQLTRLNVYSSHVFDEDFVYKQNGFTYYKGRISQGLQWGAGIEHFLDKQSSLELLYLHQSADMGTTYEAGTSNPSKLRNYGLGINYILLGGNAHVTNRSHKIEGYGGVFAGMAIIEVNDNADNGNYRSSTKLSWMSKLGANVWVTPRVGIKFQGQLSSTIQAMGKNRYLGAVGMSAYSSMWQFSVGGGLVFGLGK